MIRPPRVSFILPIFNAAPYLAETLASLFTQTFEDFEIIAINDGSTDGTTEILHAADEPRLRVIERENRGLVATLNEAVSLARADYLARIDADDICLPHRLATQTAFLDAHSEISVLGSAIETFSPNGDIPASTIAFPHDPTASLLFRNALAHPSVMMRKTTLLAHRLEYETPYRCAQDYGLWCQCAARNIRMANLPEPLIRYRLHAGQLTQQRADEMEREADAIRAALLNNLSLSPTPAQCALHNAISRNQFAASPDFVYAAAAWLVNLATWKLPLSIDRDLLMQTLTGRYVTLWRFAQVNGIPTPGDTREKFADYIHPGILD